MSEIVKIRADVLLVQKGLVASRAKAQAAIEKGLVKADGKTVLKPSESFAENADVILCEQPYKYVSRAGEKLEAALDKFGISVQDAVCLDIGASTGGFTDCLLQRGAKQVFAVDVGTDQLDASLLADDRVVSIEKTDIRTLAKERIIEPDFVCSDVSFISLSMIFPEIKRLAADGAKTICLIKPQFEAGRAALNKNGIVTGKNDHIRVIKNVLAQGFANGLAATALAVSPIKGGSGNTEYIALFEMGTEISVFDADIERTVKEGIGK